MKVKLTKGDLVVYVYPVEVDGYKKNGWKSEKEIKPTNLNIKEDSK